MPEVGQEGFRGAPCTMPGWSPWERPGFWGCGKAPPPRGLANTAGAFPDAMGKCKTPSWENSREAQR